MDIPATDHDRARARDRATPLSSKRPRESCDRHSSPSAASSQGQDSDPDQDHYHDQDPDQVHDHSARDTLRQAHNTSRASARDTSPTSSSNTTIVKKKRTRTLTTAHQSAVLHALLQRSRFPTTAMREEVGRSIGLSARKVQVWFQNQRQKARRARGQDGPTDSPYIQGGSPSTASAALSAPPTGPMSMIYSSQVPHRVAVAASPLLRPAGNSPVFDSPERDYAIGNGVYPSRPHDPQSSHPHHHHHQQLHHQHPQQHPQQHPHPVPRLHIDTSVTNLPPSSSYPHPPLLFGNTTTSTNAGPTTLPSPASIHLHQPRSAFPSSTVNTLSPLDPRDHEPIHLAPLRIDHMHHSGNDTTDIAPTPSTSTLTDSTSLPSTSTSAHPPSLSSAVAATAASSIKEQSTTPILPPPFTLQPEPMWSPTPLPAFFSRRGGADSARGSPSSMWDPNRLDIPSMSLKSRSPAPPGGTETNYHHHLQGYQGHHGHHQRSQSATTLSLFNVGASAHIVQVPASATTTTAPSTFVVHSSGADHPHPHNHNHPANHQQQPVFRTPIQQPSAIQAGSFDSWKSSASVGSGGSGSGTSAGGLVNSSSSAASSPSLSPDVSVKIRPRSWTPLPASSRLHHPTSSLHSHHSHHHHPIPPPPHTPHHHRPTAHHEDDEML